MASMNKVTLIGNLGKDPELRYTKTQTAFARFSLATTEEFTSGGEKQKRTSWHNLVVWGKQAEIAGRYLHKGKQIYVEGKLEYREYQDQSGQKRSITDIRVDRFLMLGPAGQQGEAPQHGKYGPPASQPGQGQQPQQPQQYGNQGGSQDYGHDSVPESDDIDEEKIPF